MAKKKKTARAATTKRAKTKKVEAPADYSKPLKNAKHERFCLEYVKDGNAKQSYIRAGYVPEGAEANGCRLTRNDKVKGRISHLQSQVAEECGLNARMITKELMRIGFANIQDVIGKDNAIKDISGVPRGVAAAVESIQTDIRHDGGVSDGYTEKVKLRFHSKSKALENLGRRIGYFEADNAQMGMTLADIAAKAGALKGV